MGALRDLEEFDLEGNKFWGVMTNDIWNMLAEMPNFRSLKLEGNDFEIDFSTIHIETESNLIYLSMNNMDNVRGSMDVENFFSAFYKLQTIELEWNGLFGHFEDLDVLHNLRYIYFARNSFSGQLKFSNAAFHEKLTQFCIDYNNFFGDVDWNIFAGLYQLNTIDMNNNYLTGTINWTIISDLYTNGALKTLDINNNDFEGYADFSWMDPSYTDVDIWIDENILCDPDIYPCRLPVDRNSV